MKVETLPVIKGENNLPNYDEAYANFNWEEVNKNFTWNEAGRVNMAYEAIDKHAKSDRKNKVAFIIKMDLEKRSIHLRK
ncbi:acetyl-CoA synthetase [Bacillus anthracis]|nr:acetyl-CoA synthetase [Bacillus anthracis]